MKTTKLIIGFLFCLQFFGCSNNKSDCNYDELIEKEIFFYSIDSNANAVLDKTISNNDTKGSSKWSNFLIASKPIREGFLIYIEELRLWRFDFYYCEGIIVYKGCYFLLLGDFPSELLTKNSKNSVKVKCRRYLDRKINIENGNDDSFLFWNYQYKNRIFSLLDSSCVEGDN